MKPLVRVFVTCGLGTLVAQAAAHSLETVESNMREAEPNIEFLAAPALDIRLRTPLGRPASLTDFRGKVVVLNVLDSVGTEESDLQLGFIAQLQAMVETARLSDRICFVTVISEPLDAGPEQTEPSALARAHGLERSNWRLLYWSNPRSPSSREMAGAYGPGRAAEGVKKGPLIHVIDQAGQLRARFYGLDFSPVNLVVYVGALVNDDHSRSGRH